MYIIHCIIIQIAQLLLFVILLIEKYLCEKKIQHKIEISSRYALMPN